MKLQDPFISIAFLEQTVGSQELDVAKDAMDALSIRSYRFDKRGRIEAGIRPSVRPGAKTFDKPSHARITKRGNRFQPECQLHGKGKWCIHTLILALHQAGVQPEFKVKKPTVKKVRSDAPPLFLLSTSEKGLLFRLFNAQTQTLINDPLGFVTSHYNRLSWSRDTLEVLIENVEAPTGKSTLEVAEADASAVLFALKCNKPESAHVYMTHQKRFSWNELMPLAPELIVNWKPGKLNWHWSGRYAPVSGDHWVPGHPGFLIRNGIITMFPFLSKLPYFFRHPDGESKSQNYAELLQRLIHRQHRITWSHQSPKRIEGGAGFTAYLEAKGSDLSVSIGVMDKNQFFPLKNTNRSFQVLTPDSMIDVPKTQLERLARDMQSLKLPQGQSTTLLKGTIARNFLESAAFPEGWHVIRKEADDWFGLVDEPCEVLWDLENEEQPSYRIQGELWEHHDLMAHLLPSRNGIQLASGKTLSFNAHDLLQNHEILSSVDRAVDSGPQKQFLLQRIIDPKRTKKVDSPIISVDAKWKKILRSYQQQGLIWMLELKQQGLSGLLADDMGLGKTVQTLAFLDSCSNPLPQLVIMPKTLIGNWLTEVETFTPNRKVRVHHGPQRAKDADELQASDLIFTTYGTALKDEELLYDVHFNVVVLDEAQFIKNPNAQTTRAIVELWSDSRLALTGTPVENHLGELWSIFQFLIPDFLGPKDSVQGFMHPSSPLFHVIRKKIAPLALRRVKSIVETELPAKLENTVILPLSGVQEHTYQSILSSSRKQLNDSGKKITSILTMILRMRQTCCHPGLVSETLLTAQSCKFEYLLESLRDLHREGHAALVFSQFTRLLQLFKYDLEKENIPYLYLDGKTRNRHDIVNRFQAGEGSVFLISLKAGGTGLNLTRASYVYHMDPWWNPMVEEQATDRSHRIGQKKTVMVYKILTKGTIEEAIQKLQQKKRTQAMGLWDDSGQTLPSGLNQKDLENLIMQT